MLNYIARRLLALIPVLLVVSLVIFLLIHLVPGDPAAAILGEQATPSGRPLGSTILCLSSMSAG